MVVFCCSWFRVQYSTFPGVSTKILAFLVTFQHFVLFQKRRASMDIAAVGVSKMMLIPILILPPLKRLTTTATTAVTSAMFRNRTLAESQNCKTAESQSTRIAESQNCRAANFHRL